ncbi:S24/S26 family peptidase [Gordonibacter massiliensis (ex Traore et al. 2017)]|uniref:S24/S26 family peptidase n=1 Tax=Gordonibacter massiliensis (ex Traore et al. 2017) TaxID=1841863 RepID=UPI001C8B6DDA|nr:S24 family peptidase [Gordonibacter massiliensis (ex Traore et al. 2017)]
MNAELIALKARLEKSGSITVALTGMCMEPLLREGDEAFVRPQDKIGIGSICAFQDADGSLNVHRVIAVDGTTVTLKGDKSNKREVVDRSHVLGVVGSVRLCGVQGWREMPAGPARRYISAQFSKRIYHDTAIVRSAPAAKAARLYRRFFRHALMAFNRQARARMLNNPTGSSQPDFH